MKMCCTRWSEDNRIRYRDCYSCWKGKMDRKIVAIVLLTDTPMPGFEHLLCKEAMPEGGFSSTKVANITQEITDKYVKINLFVLFP